MKGEVYSQSVCIMNAVIYKYYMENKTGAQIAKETGISTPTVSRLLKRAKDEGMLEIKIKEPYMTCILLEQEMKKRYDLNHVMVVPVFEKEGKETEDDIKKHVALEGARYVQRTIKDGDTIGLNWGGTMYHLIQYLNPCRKVNANIVTMHGSIANCDAKLAVNTLVRRAAMAFGGQSMPLVYDGLFASKEKLNEIKSQESCKNVFQVFEKINMSISGVGDFTSRTGSPLASTQYLKTEELELLEEKEVCCDILLRFFNPSGEECDTNLKDRTLSIDLETYKKIPNKVVVASGSRKEKAIKALLAGNLVDVLIIDYYLAQKLVSNL